LSFHHAVPRRPTRASEPARERLLTAALALFAQRGFEGASTHEIARLARAPQGLVRHHFGGKEGLWRETVTAGLDALRLYAQGAEKATDHTLQGGVSALVHAFDAHAELLAVLVHALLEPGPRRDWLVSERLALLRREATAWFTAASAPPRTGREHAWLVMWLGAAVALPCFGPAFDALDPRELRDELPAAVRTDTLEQWLQGRSPALAVGPWSLSAAARRRTQQSPG
jgi:AcrR family transcriptional regulator